MANFIHSDKDFQCKLCETKWVSHSSLELHLAEIHEVIYHCCDICGYHGRNFSSLSTHKRVHMENDQHCCEHCGFKCKHKHTLDEHLVLKHGVGEFKFKCETCEIPFVKEHRYKRHMETVHKYW